MNAQVQTANFVVDWKDNEGGSGDQLKEQEMRLGKIKWAENIN